MRERERGSAFINKIQQYEDKEEGTRSMMIYK